MAKETAHPGFYIPNAGDVTNPRMAEPDRVDFSTLAHPLWGVIEGCEVWVTSTLAQTTGGTLVVDGQLVTMNAGSVNLGSGGIQDRFDLVVCDAGGTIQRVAGTPATDPVFPDPPRGVTVLAAVFAPAGVSELTANVIDKRKFINKALLTKISSTETLVRNTSVSGNLFHIDGGGKTTWGTDTTLERLSAGLLKISDHLLVAGTLQVGTTITAGGSLTATGTLEGSNLKRATSPPGTGNPADIWQNTSTGKIYVRQNGIWEEMATVKSAVPVGTVITSLEIPEVMVLLGWTPLDGRTIKKEGANVSLFSVQGLQSRIDFGKTPNEMTLPNAQKMMFMTDFLKVAGTPVTTNPSNKVSITTGNLPTHGHSPQAADGGAATPTASAAPVAGHIHNISGGAHAHAIADKPHRHQGMELNYPGQIGNPGIASNVIALMWGGGNKVDALFNDRNHTYSVEAFEWTLTHRCPQPRRDRDVGRQQRADRHHS
jgi:hypothetical protein